MDSSSHGPSSANNHAGATRRRAPRARRIGEIVVDLGFADQSAVDRAISLARGAGDKTGQVLLRAGAVTQAQLAQAIAARSGVDYIDLATFDVELRAARMVDAARLREYGAVPVAFADPSTLLVAVEDHANIVALDDIAMSTGLAVRAALADPDEIDLLLRGLNRPELAFDDADDHAPAGVDTEITGLREFAERAPVVKVVDTIFASAVAQGASDIHLELDGRRLRVRMRVDGIVVDSTTIPAALSRGVVSRIKILANLNIAERRLPQDGRSTLTIDRRSVDARVATLPTVDGESIVIRLLDRPADLDLARGGMHPADLAQLQRALRRPSGAVLVTGPTGAGKSTTLYAALTALHRPEKTIVTIEDPVEYRMSGVKQVQVDVGTGLTFPVGLRAIMRSDPDIIMVGEVRDAETAGIAIDSALTGHLVLTTMHTNDAPAAISRLSDLGVEPFLAASAVTCVVAQRLARVLCDACKRQVTISPEMLAAGGFEHAGAIDAYEAGGCKRCHMVGYRGRIGLFEVMPISERIRALTMAREPAERIAEAAVAEGMRSLRYDGLDKLKLGVTSLAEVARVTGVQ